MIYFKIMYIKNKKNRYQIKTPNGWSKFDGLNIIEKDQILEIIFSDNKKIRCSENHRFYKNNIEIKAKFLNVRDFLDGKYKKSEIKKIKKIKEKTKLYDLVNVEKNNIYYTDDLISHNCNFLGSAGTLISSYALKNLIYEDPLETSFENKFKIYSRPTEGNQYIVMIDPGGGLGLDYSTVQVLDITKNDVTKQVAVYKDNKISIKEFPFVIKKISELYNDALIIGENNLFTEVLSDLNYELDANVFFDNKFGIRMTRGSKSSGNSFLKRDIEDGNLKIVDFDTISEFSTYIRVKQSYEADIGYHDDLVTPLVLFSYFIKNKTWIENWLDNEDKYNPGNIKHIEENLLPAGFVNNGNEMENFE